MPLLRIEKLRNGGLLGIWQMSESPTCDAGLLDEARHLYRSVARQREYVCVRLLLREMLGCHDVVIEHLASGKPVLKGDNRTLSISHTRGYCAALLTNGRGGVDVEYRSNRVNTIAHRFLRPDEKAESTLTRLAVWSAKETMYKMFSEDKLIFEQMRIHLRTNFNGVTRQNPITTVLDGENLYRNLRVPITCIMNNDYVFTFSTLEEER